MDKLTQPLSPALLNEFADLLHERRNQIAAPEALAQPWTPLRAREIGEIDSALARIRRGSYGTCVECGSQIQFLHLYQHPATECCLACRPKDRSVRTA